MTSCSPDRRPVEVWTRAGTVFRNVPIESVSRYGVDTRYVRREFPAYTCLLTGGYKETRYEAVATSERRGSRAVFKAAPS
jgi:hypothetical protein